MAEFGYRGLSEECMRNENEKRILKALKENDVKALKKIPVFYNPAGCRLGFSDVPILSAGILYGDVDTIKYLIDSGCDSKEIDQEGYTALDILLRFKSYKDEKFRLEIVDILLATYANPVETVFLIGNECKMTPFFFACMRGFDAIILRFLSLIDSNSISVGYIIDYDGDNLFHYLLRSHDATSTRLETMKALIDKFPYLRRLIDAKNKHGQTPLYHLIKDNRNDRSEVGELANLFFQQGASPDYRDNDGTTYLDLAIQAKNVSIVETLLRVGCLSYDFKNLSSVSIILKGVVTGSKSKSIRIIELLLAFGYDLQKDLILYTIDERPIEFSLSNYAELRDTTGVDHGILEALRELRRSNEMLSLQRQCRNKIRRLLKVEADEVIGKLTCIPNRIKSFLLVENEEKLLKTS